MISRNTHKKRFVYFFSFYFVLLIPNLEVVDGDYKLTNIPI